MKTRYVYYDKKTGFIQEILSKKKSGRAPYIECPQSEVEGFIMGTKGIYKYIVTYDKETNKHILIEKNNVIALRKQSKNLYKIPYRKNADADLKLIHYIDNTLEISMDMSRISPLYQTNFRDDVCFERGTEIRIIAKQKDNGDVLKEIVIDAQELLESVQMFFELSDKIYSNNVEFFTYKLFNDYSWYKGTVKLTSPIKERIKFNIHKADSKIRSKNFSYHLIIKPIEGGISIKNNIDSLPLIRFYDRLEFFIVDKHDPNILYEKFFLSEELLEKKNMIMPLRTDVKEKMILYNHKYISVLLEG